MFIQAAYAQDFPEQLFYVPSFNEANAINDGNEPDATDKEFVTAVEFQRAVVKHIYGTFPKQSPTDPNPEEKVAHWRLENREKIFGQQMAADFAFTYANRAKGQTPEDQQGLSKEEYKALLADLGVGETEFSLDKSFEVNMLDYCPIFTGGMGCEQLPSKHVLKA